jgi:hypothetical protein
MKRRNPGFGCVRIAQQISLAFGVDIDKDVVPGNIDGLSMCRMFNYAIAGQPLPKHLSTDHDPLFRFHRWLANLRMLEIDEIKSVPYTRV